MESVQKKMIKEKAAKDKIEFRKKKKEDTASKTSVLLAVAKEEKLSYKRNEKTRKGKQKKI